MERRACFLSRTEREQVLAGEGMLLTFRQALRRRVLARIQQPGLPQPEDGTGWWYVSFEYLSDAAMLYALEQDAPTGAWLRDVTLSIARLPVEEWVGPWFRDHSEPYIGHLETAHVCWGMASVLDLAGSVLTEAERAEVKQALVDKGVVLCERWLARHTHLANWRGILLAGVLVPAAVLGDDERLATYVPYMEGCLAAFQPDGSYAESLQYGNYLALAMALVYESLARVYPAYAAAIDITAYAKGMPWIASSMLYTKPLTGWGEEPRARAVNFNDSAAIFRPSGDVLLHIARRKEVAGVRMAGLASSLFQQYYAACPDQGPHHLASFGFVNDWGFLTLPLLTDCVAPLTPEAAEVPLTSAFENGNTFIRDAWEGKTVIAIQGGAAPLYGPGHLHGDVNSFLVVHNRERLLIDPGHSCYRNLIHGLESSSQTHTTCTFLVEEKGMGLQEDLTKTQLLEQQSILSKRQIKKGVVGEPVVRGNRQLIAERRGAVTVVGSEAAALYGEPITEFSRFWISAGSHVVFVVDRIRSTAPVRTCWNWVVNNRDGLASVVIRGGELTVKRPLAGLKIRQGGGTVPMGPIYGYAHDAYHPEPARKGEGRPGSGWIYRAIEPEGQVERLAVHVLAMDEPEGLVDWELTGEMGNYRARRGTEDWLLTIGHPYREGFVLRDVAGNRHWQVENVAGKYRFI